MLQKKVLDMREERRGNKVGKRGRGMTMRKVWKRGRRSRRGGREEEEEDKKVEEKGNGRSKKGEKMRGGEQRQQEGTGLYDFFPVGESRPCYIETYLTYIF